jgi:hypothetical protein
MVTTFPQKVVVRELIWHHSVGVKRNLKILIETDFKNLIGDDLGPGDYNWVEDWEIDNDRIKSIMLAEG